MRKRLTNSEIKARLVLMVGVALSLTFIMSVGMILYSLTFVITSCSDRVRGNCVTQPDAPRCDTSNGATTP